MQQELATLSFELTSSEAPSPEHGHETAAWLMRRCPEVTVKYIEQRGATRAGMLYLSAADEDAMWVAACAWMAKETGPWPVIPETGAVRRPVFRKQRGRLPSAWNAVKSWAYVLAGGMR